MAQGNKMSNVLSPGRNTPPVSFNNYNHIIIIIKKNKSVPDVNVINNKK